MACERRPCGCSQQQAAVAAEPAAAATGGGGGGREPLGDLSLHLVLQLSITVC